MRVAAILVLLLGVGFLAGHAVAADPLPPVPTISTTLPTISTTVPSVTVPLPPVTTVTTPSVTTPSVTTPTVTTPHVTTPSVTTPRVTTPVGTTPSVTTPSATTPKATVPSVTTPSASVGSSTVGGSSSVGGVSATGGSVGGAGGASGAAGAGGASGAAGAGGATGGGSSSTAPGGGGSGGASRTAGGVVVTSSSSPRGTIVVSDPAGPRDVSHLSSSRTWIGRTGKKHRRVTTLTFVLRHGGRVVFTVRQVSPVCRAIGRFAVRGHAGVNKVNFTGRVHGHQLQPGTYRLNARTASGHAVQRAVLVVLDSAPSREQLAALRAANVCASANGSASTTAFFSSSGATDIGGFASPEHVQRSLAPKNGEPAGVTFGGNLGGNPQGGPAVASAVEQTARAIRPMLVALLGIAIVLLALASLPQAALPDPRLNYALARHRLEIATFGAAALAAVIIAFAIG